MTAEKTDSGTISDPDPTAIEGLSKSIWQLTEDVLELLRSQSRYAVHSQKKPDLLWLDDLTETQSNTVIAIRQLCEESPEGITLKKLAETMGVTPAAASVMVDLLVKKKMLKRTKSKSDRRAVLIRLMPETADLFEISERTLLETFLGLQESLGASLLLDWQRTLLTATAALREVVAKRAQADEEQEAGISPSAPEGEPS